MRSLTRAIGCAAAAAALLAGTLALPAAVPIAPASAAVASPASGGCTYQPVNGAYQWVCVNVSTTAGQPATGTVSGSKSQCTLTPLSQGQASFLGLQWPPPKQHTWDAITCPGTQPFGGVILADDAAGAPAVNPMALLQIAVGELVIPAPALGTAPPVGHDGLVGLPEWFWVTNWNPVPRTVQAGPVWARAIAVPQKIIFSPGGGLGNVTCDGPGAQYQRKLPLSAQHTGCSYIYDQPSAGQPGNVYQASVSVSWNVSYRLSNGVTGTVATGRLSTTTLPLAIAAGEALVTTK